MKIHPVVKSALLILVFIFGFCLPIVCAFRDMMNESDRERRETHQAWQKIHPEMPLSYDEWRHLKTAKLLPGQERAQ